MYHGEDLDFEWQEKRVLFHQFTIEGLFEPFFKIYVCMKHPVEFCDDVVKSLSLEDACPQLGWVYWLGLELLNSHIFIDLDQPHPQKMDLLKSLNLLFNHVADVVLFHAVERRLEELYARFSYVVRDGFLYLLCERSLCFIYKIEIPLDPRR